MEPIIYKLPSSDAVIEIKKTDINFDKEPNPPLMKYGFNNLLEKININELTSNEHYVTGLNFDFTEKKDKDETNFVNKGKKYFNTNKFDQTFAEFWEILNLFGLLNSDQNIYTNEPATIKDIIQVYQKLAGSKNKINVSDNLSKSVTLAIKKYSDIELDENVIQQLIIDDIVELLGNQNNGSNLIIQLYSLQTQTTAELIYYLSTLYTEAYISKPAVIPDISDSKYLVLLGMKVKPTIAIPKHSKNVYLSHFGIEKLPNNIITVIQCINSYLVPKKISKYYKIKAYLDNKIYEGHTQQQMIKEQNENTQKWFETFVNFPKIKSILDEALKKTDTKCDHDGELDNLFKVI